jgi:hypothetical protein
MKDRSLRVFRVLEVVIPGGFSLLGVLAAASPRHPLGLAAGLWIFAAFAVLMFELRFWGHRRKVARVWRGLEEVGRRDLEGGGPVVVRDGDDFVEELASNRALAGLMASRSHRLCIAGGWRGRRLEIGTAVVAGRDFDQLVSYVCVLDQSIRGNFRMMTRGALASFARLGTHRQPVQTGDAAFDGAWVVDSEEPLARAVLDPPMRAKLVGLQGQLGWMQIASVEATRFGLLVRWPGELSPDGAAYLRDLAVDVHQRLAES